MTLHDAFVDIYAQHLKRAKAGDNLSSETVLLLELIKTGWLAEDELSEPPALNMN